MLRIRIIEASYYFELLRNAEQHSIIGKGVSTHRPRDSTHTSDSAGLLNILANLFAIALLLAHHLPQPQSISLSSFSSHTFGCWPRIWFLAPRHGQIHASSAPRASFAIIPNPDTRIEIRSRRTAGPQREERAMYKELCESGYACCCYGDGVWESRGWADG